MNAICYTTVLILILVALPLTDSFVPASLVDKVFGKVDKLFLNTLDITAETITHDDIVKYGLIQSVVEYFYNQPNGSKLINRTKANKEYYELNKLYYDYYGLWFCDIPLNSLISYVFKPSVALVDLDPDTKDFPYAHFDAETFIQSNYRVMNFSKDVFDSLKAKDYTDAQVYAGQILHTIQDFYSHSNWVEMGKTDINYDIGYDNFTKLQIINQNETNTCANNCTLVTVECGFFLKLVTSLIDLAGFKFSIVSCPLTYYRCDNNILILNKLISGYYGGQKLPNGQLYTKPENLNKCSHGGMFDKTADQIAKGGINKDSGYYIVSPHANLHQKAAQLAIMHTKFFFENIRAKIGDKEYAKFLQLELTSDDLLKGRKEIYICGSTSMGFNKFLFYVICLILCMYYSYF